LFVNFSSNERAIEIFRIRLYYLYLLVTTHMGCQCTGEERPDAAPEKLDLSESLDLDQTPSIEAVSHSKNTPLVALTTDEKSFQNIEAKNSVKRVAATKSEESQRYALKPRVDSSSSDLRASFQDILRKEGLRYFSESGPF